MNYEFSILNFSSFNSKFKIQNLKLKGILFSAVVGWITVFLPSIGFSKAPFVPETAPLNIQVPAFDVKTLTCGIKVIFLKNDEMPLVSINLMIPGGSILDPEGQEGLGSLMTSCLRNGGAGDLSPEAFDAALENKAVDMSASVDKESFSAGFKCLSRDLPEVLPLFADMLRRPQFNIKRFETDKADSIDEVSRLEDTPDALTRVLFSKALLDQSPYGHSASPKSLSLVKQGDVLKFYQAHLGPAGSVLEVTGNVDEEKVLAQLESLFGDWTAQEKLPDYAEAKSLGPVIYFYPKQVSQVFIRFGVLGLKRHDPQDIPLSVANYILGGSGFTSRLMHQIRSDRGLAYFVDSVTVPFNIRGIFEVIGGTRPDSVKEYLTVMFQVLNDFAKTGPTESELQQAQKSMVEEFAYNFESPFALADYHTSLTFNGYPDDYLQTYRDEVKAVTQVQAASAASAILSQKDWVLIVAGPEELEKDLEAFGTVHKVTSIFDPLVSNP
jgi:zinc protease